LGTLAVGYQVDAAVAQQLAIAANNQIALATSDTVIASTLPVGDEAELSRRIRSGQVPEAGAYGTIALATDHYAFSSVLLHGSSPSPVYCYVMMPLVPVNTFLRRLSYSIYLIAGLTVLFGGVLIAFVARTITRPLDNLVAGVKALASGDFTYTITPRGSSELVELSSSFAQMRGQLLALQQQRIETERIGHWRGRQVRFLTIYVITSPPSSPTPNSCTKRARLSSTETRFMKRLRLQRIK
jgi:methyl-accepting chemotaxis protein